MRNNNNNKIRNVESKPALKTVKISPGFRTFFNLDKTSELTLPAMRIIIKIINDLTRDQYKYVNNTDNFKTLFDQELDSDFGSYMRFTFSISDVVVNRNVKQIKEALEFLMKYKQGWYESENIHGVKVKSHVGFVNNPVFSPGKLSFLVPKYWCSKILNTFSYNELFYDLAWKAPNINTVRFAIWISTLESGTTIKIKSLNERFVSGKGYYKVYDLKRYFLDKMKGFLDKEGFDSFNYKINGDKVEIVKYKVVNAIRFSEDSKEDVEKLYKYNLNKKLNYFKNQNDLTTQQVSTLRSMYKNNKKGYYLFLEAYRLYKRKCKQGGFSVKDFKGEEFLTKISKIMEHLSS